MVSRRRPLVQALGLLLLALVVSCEKVPLLAPTGSTITLTTATNVVSVSGTADIVAQVLESSGTPPHSGTHVTFTTTLGRIEPTEAETDANGQALVKFIANGSSGTASIVAFSGGASTGTAGALKLSVGTAAVGAVRVSANPATVSALGGSTIITANVFDVNGNSLPLVPVVFSTTTGSISATVVTTDASGVAQTTLTTSQQATVTASVGAQGIATSGTGTGTATGGTTTSAPTSGQASGTVTVTVSAAPTLVITPPTTSPSAGIPAQFTFVVTVPSNGAAVRSLRVDWGDGSSQDLGTVTGNAVVAHTYRSTGSYTVTGTLTDASGNVQSVATAVNVIPVASPTIVITPSVPSSCTGAGSCPVSFQLQVTPPTGVGIVSVTVDFGVVAIPPQQGLGGLTGSATLSARYPAGAGAQTVVVTVRDTLSRTTQGFTTVNIP